MVAAWPGIGNVALKAASYLRDKLGAEGFADVEPSGYFSPGGVSVQENVIKMPRFPQNRFYSWQGKGVGSDMLIFIAEAQPALRQYELANLILDVAQEFNVQRLYTFAAAVVPHRSEEVRVWGAATDARLLRELEGYGVTLRGDFLIRGLNGLLLGVAEERGIPGICLLGETPQQYAELENPTASLSVLRVLLKILRFEIDMADLEKEAKQAEAEMERITKETMTEFIDRFTKPIWERGEEENE
jgi:hypothetical protein